MTPKDARWGEFNRGKHSKPQTIVLLESYFNDAPQAHFTTEAEVITEGNDFTHHVISHVFKVGLTEQFMPMDHDFFAYEWHNLTNITSDNPEFAKAAPREFLRYRL